MKIIQVSNPAGEQSKTIQMALETQKNFKVLPYPEVERRLDANINYPNLNERYKKGNI
jgi:hypothetical protein